VQKNVVFTYKLAHKNVDFDRNWLIKMQLFFEKWLIKCDFVWWCRWKAV